jgi:predicted PhzF superfamily epimerase YddE/YHI9
LKQLFSFEYSLFLNKKILPLNCVFVLDMIRRPSSITHGKDRWYDLELDILQQKKVQQPPTTKIKKQGIHCFVVDAFADPVLNGTGNPAAVVVFNDDEIQKLGLSTVVSDAGRTNLPYATSRAQVWMQSVAKEFNLSETAFVWPIHDNDQLDGSCIRYCIKYFTPTVEIPLCGHATLASASVLFQLIMNSTDASTSCSRALERRSINFYASENVVLEANLEAFDTDEERFTNVSMIFPSASTKEIVNENDKAAIRGMLKKSLGIHPSSILYMGCVNDLSDLLIELDYDSFMGVPHIGIDFTALHEWGGYNRGIIISCIVAPTNSTENEVTETIHSCHLLNDLQLDFFSRFFAPKAGINEDPVTGSAHCALAPYYSQRLNGKISVIGQQKSARSGIVHCRLLEGDKRVQLTGTAVNAVSGTLWLQLPALSC